MFRLQYFCLMRRLCRKFAFEDADMEQKYQAQGPFCTVSLTQFWAFFSLTCTVSLVLFRGTNLDWFKGQSIGFALHFLPIVAGLAVGFASIKTEWITKHCRKVIHIACIVMVGWTAWSAAFMGTLLVEDIPKDFPKVWNAIEGYPEAQSELVCLLSDEFFRRQIWFHLVLVSYSLGMLQYLGLSCCGTAVYLSLPVCYNIMAFIMSPQPSKMADIVVATTYISIFLMCASFYWTRIHRQQFQLNHVLQQMLAKEAQAMESLALQEKAHKETSQHADTILNHILKNMMADASGCIHLYLESLLGEPPKDLIQAVTCLDRGMSWCRKRQTLLQVASKHYVPILSPIAIHKFAVDVVNGRQVKCNFIDAVVNVDRVLCEIVLDNAISNAFRHGHPDDPQVTFSISLSQCSPSEPSTLKIVITNRANPLNPPLTPRFISQTLAGKFKADHSALSLTSDRIGLQHLFMAAEAHNMSLSLWQESDKVTLQASMPVTLGSEGPTTGALLAHPESQLPMGLNILCIDDSPIARRVLLSTLRRHFVGCTVEVYGEDARDISTFIHNALSYANIVILDQFLDYGSASFMGTDLLQSLIAQGYSGFACIRSANVSHDNQAEFLRTGAHCAIGKDVHPKDMVRLISASYMQFHASFQLTEVPSMDFPYSLELPSRCSLPGAMDIP